MTLWLCVETRRIHANSRWLRLKLAFWQRLASRFDWPHRVCRHYIRLPQQE